MTNKLSFDVTGMSCAACSAQIEKGLLGLDGMNAVTVNLLTNSMSVTFEAAKIDAGQIIRKVEDIGYGASMKTTDAKKQTVEPVDSTLSETLRLRESSDLLRRQLQAKRRLPGWPIRSAAFLSRW